MNKIFENWQKFLEHDENDIDVIAKVMIFNKDGEALVMKRGKTAPKYPNFWDLPGGHLLKGETLVQGATRETKEEIGLNVDDLKEVGKYNNVHFFTTNNYSGEEIKNMPEHSEKKWISAKELKDFEFPPGGSEALKQTFKQNKLLIQEEEPYQRQVTSIHCKLKNANINSGGNNKKEGKGVKNASCERSNNAPPGAGGA